MNTESYLPFLFELLAKSAAILLTAALIVRVWRRATAAQRHFVWFAAIVTLLILPMTRLVAPRWTVPLEPATKVRIPMTVLSLAPVVEASVSADPIPPPRRSAWKLPDWRSVLIGVWLGGGGLLFGYRLLGSWRLRRLEKRSARLEDARVQAMAGEILRELNVTCAVKIRVSETCRVPMTWGVRRPVLMLPREALTWNDTRLLAALRHEAGHISRQDYLVRGIAQAVCALYWPNPLVWFAARSLRVAQEQATDDLVLRAGTSAEDYAAQLFDAARTVAERGFFAPHAVAMASPSTLEDRVLAIVDDRRDRRPLSRRVVVFGSVLVALTVAISTAGQLQGADRAPSPAAERSGPAGANPRERQVEIEAKFVEIALGTPDAGVSENKLQFDLPLEKIEGVFSDPQFQVVIRALNQKKGVDLMSAPRVTTRSKQLAVIEIVRDFRSPSDWEKDPEGTWKPKEFESKNVGVTLEVEPEIKADGTIELRLKPSVVEFLGFVDLDTGKSVAAKGDLSQPGTVVVIPDLAPVKPVKRLKPVFSERKIETTVTLQDGYTVALSGMKETADVKPFEARTTGRKLIVFISARVIEPTGSAVAGNDASSEAKNPALTKARKIILPKFELSGASVAEAVDLLRQKAREFDEEKQGLNLVLKEGVDPGVEITLSLTNVPLIEAIHYVANLANVQFVAEGNAFILGPSVQAAPSKPAPAKPSGSGDVKVAPAGSAALDKARKLILKDVEFRMVTVSEAVDSLNRTAREHDEDKKGVNVILKPGFSADARFSLALTNVPLSEALRYVAGLAGLELRAEPTALVLQRPDGNAGLKSKPTATPSTATAKEMPIRHATAALFTREWKITAEQLRRALGSDASHEALKAALIERRVAFPEGSALAWLPEKERLVMRNTGDNLQRLEALIKKAVGP